MRQELLAAEAPASAVNVDADADFDRATTKILHLTWRPGEAVKSCGKSQALLTENSALRDEVRRLRQVGAEAALPVPAGDLEQQQAARELRRFKRCTKKYVEDFREGVWNLLGWKIESVSNAGGEMQWHITSRYQEAQELIFQLRPKEAGHTPEFDLLGTEWGEQLQADRQAMAYLEVYNSIPGFLAHITAD